MAEPRRQPALPKIDWNPARPPRTGWRDRFSEPEVDAFGADDYSEEGYA